MWESQVATELPAPKRTRIQRFGDIDATNVPPISVYTSQGRLAAILNEENNNDSLSNANKGRREENEDEDEFFSRKEIPKDLEEISNPFPKFPLAPVDKLLPKPWLLNQRIGTITLI